MTMTMTPYKSAQQPGRDGFVQLLRAEWTKFRTVRGWVIAVIAAAALTALIPIDLAGTGKNSTEACSHGKCQVQGQTIAVGPAGDAVTDTFYFVHQPVGRDGSITVRVTSFHGSGPLPQLPTGLAPAPRTEPWAKAGLIIKASTRPGSAYAAMIVTGSHGVRMQYDFTHDISGNAATVSPAAPQWLRLTRSGDSVTGYDSVNGKQWTEIGTADLAGLPATAQAGLFVASPMFNEAVGTGDNTTGGPTEATGVFDHLSLHGGLSGQSWTGTQVISATPAQRVPGARITCHGNCGRTPLAMAGGFVHTGGSYKVTGSGDIAPFEPIVDPLHVVFYGTLFGLIAIIALGALFITAEYRRGMIRTTMAASPRRGRVLLAKAIVVGAVTFVAGLVGAAIAFPVVQHKLYANGWKPPVWPDLSLTSTVGLQVVFGTAAIAAGAAILGLVAGAIFRRSAAAVIAIIGVVVMPLILAVLLPITTATWLLKLTPAAAFSLQQTVTRYPQVSNVCSPYHACFPMSPWDGYLVMCAWAVAGLAGAMFLMRRRDV
jgi:ABC-2 family transporter protein